MEPPVDVGPVDDAPPLLDELGRQVAGGLVAAVRGHVRPEDRVVDVAADVEGQILLERAECAEGLLLAPLRQLLDGGIDTRDVRTRNRLFSLVQDRASGECDDRRVTSVRRIVPDLTTADIAEARRFYTSLLGLDELMDIGWVSILGSPDSQPVQLILMTKDASGPVNPDLSIEVDDVDAVFAAAQASGAEVVHPITDEPWGVRRFFVRDPDGHVVNVVGQR